MIWFIDSFMQVSHTMDTMPWVADLRKVGNCFDSELECIRKRNEILKILKGHAN